MKPKHCNRANIWGVLDKCEEMATKGRGNPYLEVIIDCQHEEYGAVRALGFVWGAENVEYFKTKFSRGDELRLSGNLQQYTGRGKATRTTFNFYVLKPGPVKEHKAAFILVGEVEELSGEALHIRVNLPASGNYTAKEDTFKVVLPHDLLLSLDKTPEAGQTVSVKGYLMQEEDEFGDVSRQQRPIVKEIRFL